MPTLSLHRLNRRLDWRRRARRRLWREWCFLRAILGQFGPRLLVMAGILLGAALLFITLEPEKQHPLPRAVYYAWSLIFGQAPEEFPASHVLQALYFVMPILGLTVIVEGIIDFSRLLRDRQLYEKRWCLKMAETMNDHVILVGLGKLGFRIFSLLRQLDQPVLVIERDAANEFLDDVRKDGSPLLIGDGRREQLLTEANIARARSVVLATDDDLANMEIALDARRLRPDVRVVLRMFDQNMADKIRSGFNIHLAMSQSAISGPAFAMAAMDRAIVNSFVVDDQLIVMLWWEARADGPLAGLKVEALLRDYGFAVVERRGADGARGLFPGGGELLAPGDRLLVQGTFESLQKLGKRSAALLAG